MNQILEVTLDENELVNINGGFLMAIIGWSYVGGLAYGYISEKLRANHTK